MTAPGGSLGKVHYFVREAWRGLWHHRSYTWTALLALVGALIVPGVFLVVLVNTLNAAHTLGSRREMVVFLRPDVADSARAELAQRLSRVARSVTYVSREQAWQEMAHELGGTELLEAVGENPLPDSYRVQLRPHYLHFAAMDSIATAVGQDPAVEEVQFGGQWVRRLDRFFETLRVTGLGIASVIGLVVLFVVANTIRLTVIARREIHRVLLLMGASSRFVRAPLVLEGLLISLLGAVVALVLLYVLFLYLEPKLAVLPVFLPWRWIAGFLLAAAVLGAAGSALAVSRLSPEERVR